MGVDILRGRDVRLFGFGDDNVAIRLRQGRQRGNAQGQLS